jgi:hypothetical protein
MKACPYCWEKIQNVAKKCRFCWEFLEWEKKSEIKNSSDKSKLIMKILYTICFISFMLLFLWWLDPTETSFKYWHTPFYVYFYLIPLITFWIGILSLTIILCWNKSKKSLIILWIDCLIILCWWLLQHYTNHCDIYGCYNLWRNIFWEFIIIATIPALFIWFIIYILRLIRWWKNKN